MATFPSNEFASEVVDRPFRWRQHELKLAVFVEGENKREVLDGLRDELAADISAFQNETGIKITLGLWADKDPAPNIFLQLGTEKELLARSEYLGSRFDEPEIPMQMQKKSQQGTAICEGVVGLAEKQTIVQALIIADVNKSPNYCVRRQLMVAFGFFGDLPEGSASILAEPNSPKFITSLDRLFLNHLYQMND